MAKQPRVKGISLKKKYGQHFLRRDSVVHEMLNHVELTDASIFEIGPGDGFLTRYILQQPVKRLWAFEIDTEWAQLLRETIEDDRFTVYERNILDVDFSLFEPHAPWTLLANLPYQVTFPILHRLQKHRALLREGVIMIQEEVAQKLVKTKGRGYGYPSLFFNHYFDIQLLSKVPPEAFMPPPKVDSRLVYIKPKKDVVALEDEHAFWRFIKSCFRQPRRTLRNNIKQTQYAIENIPEEYRDLRAQQLSKQDLVGIWQKLRS